MRLAAVIAMLVVTVFARPVFADEIPQQTKDYLQGGWLLGQKPDKGPCISHWYEKTSELELEFQKSGGRALFFEPYDAFTPVTVPNATENNGIVSLQARRADGRVVPFMRIRLLPPDRIEILSQDDRSAAKIAYRCDVPDLKPTGDVPVTRLALLAPIIGSAGLVEAQNGVPDADVCRGKHLLGAAQVRTLQFELIGPAHYWMIAWPYSKDAWGDFKLTYAFIRSVTVISDNTLRLEMQEHLEAGEGWDVPKSRGRPFTLTVKERPDGHLEIPEFKGEFIRCGSIETKP